MGVLASTTEFLDIQPTLLNPTTVIRIQPSASSSTSDRPNTPAPSIIFSDYIMQSPVAVLKSPTTSVRLSITTPVGSSSTPNIDFANTPLSLEPPGPSRSDAGPFDKDRIPALLPFIAPVTAASITGRQLILSDIQCENTASTSAQMGHREDDGRSTADQRLVSSRPGDEKVVVTASPPGVEGIGNRVIQAQDQENASLPGRAKQTSQNEATIAVVSQTVIPAFGCQGIPVNDTTIDAPELGPVPELSEPQPSATDDGQTSEAPQNTSSAEAGSATSDSFHALATSNAKQVVPVPVITQIPSEEFLKLDTKSGITPAKDSIIADIHSPSTVEPKSTYKYKAIPSTEMPQASPPRSSIDDGIVLLPTKPNHGTAVPLGIATDTTPCHGVPLIAFQEVRSAHSAPSSKESTALFQISAGLTHDSEGGSSNQVLPTHDLSTANAYNDTSVMPMDHTFVPIAPSVSSFHPVNEGEAENAVPDPAPIVMRETTERLPAVEVEIVDKTHFEPIILTSPSKSSHESGSSISNSVPLLPRSTSPQVARQAVATGSSVGNDQSPPGHVPEEMVTSASDKSDMVKTTAPKAEWGSMITDLPLQGE